MKKLVTLLTLMSMAFMGEASVITDISQSPGLGSNIDLTSGSYITWGYDADSLIDGFTNYKAGTTVAAVSPAGSNNTRDYGFTFTFNDGNSPGSGTATSSGSVAGLGASTINTITFSGIVSSTETRRLTLYMGGYHAAGSSKITATLDATLTGGTADETGTARSFVVDSTTSDAVGFDDGYAVSTYTVDFTSATESDLVIDVSFSNVSGTKQWGLSGYTVEVIPEPATMGLVSIAGLGLIWVRRRWMSV